jgi:hypothetical protein
LRLTGNLNAVFVALSIALTAFGLINAAAVAGGAWFAFGEPAKASTEPIKHERALS